MFTFNSPDLDKLQADIKRYFQQLSNTTYQMTLVLEEVRADVDKQFDENQGTWKRLAPYTVKKKAKRDADPRILHETKTGQGERLRDAYRKTGEVTTDGDILFYYPITKPYAQEHQTGKRPKLSEKKKKQYASRQKKWNNALDEEFFDRINRND